MDDELQPRTQTADETLAGPGVMRTTHAEDGPVVSEVDLTGQICADSIGHRIYSGIGGQMDFIRGAALSPGGKAVIALPSTACKGTVSRIVLQLEAGSGVVTTRGHVHWVATEYGAVNLHGRSLRERGEALISIAHPDFRAGLRKELASVRHFTPLG